MATAHAASLTVQVVGLSSGAGQVGCNLHDGPTGYPTEPTSALQRRWCPIVDQVALCRFDPVPAGTYALACFHDENGDGALDTGLFGIPTERTVASNQARARFGPPRFDDAKFPFSGAPAELRLTLDP